VKTTIGGLGHFGHRLDTPYCQYNCLRVLTETSIGQIGPQYSGRSASTIHQWPKVMAYA
jgi:hypothetical protein